MALKITFRYKSNTENIDVSNNVDIRNILEGINSFSEGIWQPNETLDNQIRDYVEDYVRHQKYYVKGVHASNIEIIKDGKEFHVIPEYMSDEAIKRRASEIIKDSE